MRKNLLQSSVNTVGLDLPLHTNLFNWTVRELKSV